MQEERTLVSFDWAIKYLLRNKANYGILEGFLTTLLGKKIKIQNLTDSESNKDTKGAKVNRVDVLAEEKDGTLIIVEVQFTPEIDYFHRMLFGSSKAIVEHLGKGMPYSKVKKVYSVNVVYFDLGSGRDYIYHGTTTFRGLHYKDELKLTDKQKEEFAKLEVKDIYPEYYILKVDRFRNIVQSKLDEWMYFLRNSKVKPKFKAPGLREAMEKLEYSRLSAKERRAYDKYVDNERSNKSTVYTAKLAAKQTGCIGALCFLLLCCSNPYERDNPRDSVHVYTVTFNAGEAAGGVPPADMAGYYGDVIILPNGGVKSGYAVAWNDPASGNYLAGSSYTITGNTAMSAVWVPVYTVSFDGNGATSGTAPAAMSTGSGLVVTLPGRGDLKKTEHIFAGWNTDSSGAGTRYEAGSSHTVAGNITLYAVWMWIDPEKYYYDERDSRLYRITAIGTQTWMAENLNYNATGSKCYSNLDSNCDKYGRLYNWATAMNNAKSSTAVPSGVRGVCPEGWHLPSRAEWEVMTAFIGGSSTEGKKLKATSGWNNNGNGTDAYGFSALPGGYGNSDGSFYNVGYYGYWWSASENDSYNAYDRRMYYNDEYAYWYDYGKSNLFSVRCLQD